MAKKQKKTPLNGIDNICQFVGLQPLTLMKWAKYYDFPMEKNSDSIWTAFKEDIIGYFAERGLNPKTASDERLQSHAVRKDWDNGKGWINRQLKGLGEIEHFLNNDTMFALDLANNWEGCPIQKDHKAGELSADADELYFWCQDQGFNLSFRLDVLR